MVGKLQILFCFQLRSNILIKYLLIFYCLLSIPLKRAFNPLFFIHPSLNFHHLEGHTHNLIQTHMDPKHVFVLLINILVACLWANVVAKRDLIEIKLGYKVIGNFEIGGDESHCLNRLAEITSCSTEVVDFLVKRETNLNTSCCLAISTMANHCSPTTLNLFSFTPEVYMALRGHCDGTSSSLATAPAPTPLAGSDADPLVK